MPSLQTVTDRSDRIASLDILRGFALLGMIIVHFHQGFRLTTPEIDPWPGEPLSGWVIWWGMEGKAAATFALLFGVGFAIILRRADMTGRPVLGFYLRRLAVLAMFGILVEALTGYVVLIQLAIAGIWLLLARRFSPRTLLGLAVIAALAQPLYNLGTGLHDVLTGAAATLPSPLGAPPQTYWQEVQYRLTERMPEAYRPNWHYLLPTFTVSLFVVGMAALRHGVFDEPRRHVRLITGAMAFGAVCWLIFWLLLPKVPDSWYGWHRNAWPIRYGMGVIVHEWLALTYTGAILLLLAFRPWWTQRLAAFGLVGRLGLTNYVAQAAIIYYLKSDFGLALQLRPFWRIIGALLVFSVLVLFSYGWLARFNYGPLEWMWRALSRLSLPEMRRSHPERAAPAYAVAPFAVVAVTVPLALATGLATTRSGVKELPPVRNPGFEAGTLDPWRVWPAGAAQLDSASARTGRFAGKVTKARGYLYQRVGGLLPDSTYTLRAWLRGSHGTSGYLYVKHHGRAELRSAPTADSTYAPVTLTFTMGRSHTSAEIGIGTANSGDVWVDDLVVENAALARR